MQIAEGKAEYCRTEPQSDWSYEQMQMPVNPFLSNQETARTSRVCWDSTSLHAASSRVRRWDMGDACEAVVASGVESCIGCICSQADLLRRNGIKS